MALGDEMLFFLIIRDVLIIFTVIKITNLGEEEYTKYRNMNASRVRELMKAKDDK
jgi:hypothetical protein